MSPYIPSHVFYSLRPFPYHLFYFFLISIGRNIITLSSSSPIQVSLTQLHPLDTCELFMVASRWVLVGGETQGLKGSRTSPCVSLPTGTHLQLHPCPSPFSSTISTSTRYTFISLLPSFSPSFISSSSLSTILSLLPVTITCLFFSLMGIHCYWLIFSNVRVLWFICDSIFDSLKMVLMAVFMVISQALIYWTGHVVALGETNEKLNLFRQHLFFF